MLNLKFQNGRAPALNARNMNAIVESINTMQTQLANPFTFKGSVSSVANLPSSGNTINDTYYVTEETCLYTWDGDSWEVSSMGESNYMDMLTDIKSTLGANVNAEILKVKKKTDIPFFIQDAGFVQFDNGAIVDSANLSATNFVPVSQFDTISYKRTKTSSANGLHGMCFYDKNFAYLSGVRCLTRQSESGYVEESYQVAVPENAMYARFSIFNDTELYGIFEAVGESKLSNAVECEKLYTTDYGYIDLSVGIGNTVNLTNVTSSQFVKYLVYDCTAGDKFTINGLGGINGRLYGFVDSQNILLKVATIYEDRSLYVVTAPEGASKIIIHNNVDERPFQNSYKGVMLTDTVSPMLANNNERSVSLRWENGGVNGSGLFDSKIEKRSFAISINPGETLVVVNTNKEIKISLYAIDGDNYRLVGNDWSIGSGRFEVKDWRRVYRIRLERYDKSSRPDPVTGGYIQATIISNQVPYNHRYYKTGPYPQIGIHRTYSSIKPFLTLENKTITISGIEPSNTDCLVKLPNSVWIEVKPGGYSLMFKIAKVSKNGTITFPVSEWSYYPYRFQGDSESEYYALCQNSPGADTNMDIVTRTNKLLGIFTYNDEGANYEYGYYLRLKSIAVIGDSITQGRFDKDGVSGLDSTAVKPFGELVSEIAGYDNFGNFGIGGACVSGNEWRSLLTNCGKVSGYDVVFVCGGTNDYVNDVTESAFRADYTTVIDTLMQNNTEVIACTPIYRTSKTGPNSQGLWLSDYSSIIKDIASIKGIKCIDLLSLTSNATMNDYMPDGLHPNEKGHKIIADWIVKECDRVGL